MYKFYPAAATESITKTETRQAEISRTEVAAKVTEVRTRYVDSAGISVEREERIVENRHVDEIATISESKAETVVKVTPSPAKDKYSLQLAWKPSLTDLPSSLRQPEVTVGARMGNGPIWGVVGYDIGLHRAVIGLRLDF